MNKKIYAIPVIYVKNCHANTIMQFTSATIDGNTESGFIDNETTEDEGGAKFNNTGSNVWED
ncbi:MAG: hypothetical protein K6C10_11580 [Prevotella sp.]|nr:hypothetical protein [Prevotella sp.]